MIDGYGRGNECALGELDTGEGEAFMRRKSHSFIALLMVVTGLAYVSAASASKPSKQDDIVVISDGHLNAKMGGTVSVPISANQPVTSVTYHCTYVAPDGQNAFPLANPVSDFTGPSSFSLPLTLNAKGKWSLSCDFSGTDANGQGFDTLSTSTTINVAGN